MTTYSGGLSLVRQSENLVRINNSRNYVCEAMFSHGQFSTHLVYLLVFT